MNKLKTYEAPSTRVAKVELRTNLLAASIMQDEPQSVKTEGHEVGNAYDFNVSGTGGTLNGTESSDGFSVTWD